MATAADGPSRREFLQAGLAGVAAVGLGRWFLGGEASAAAAPTPAVLLEAEAFADRGGWLLDQQSTDQIGSPYLLAHGLGRPVEDAEAKAVLPAGGRYRVWVRTRDWTAPWKTDDVPDSVRADGSPGQFRVRVNGRDVGDVLGGEGAEWHWQDAGAVDLPAGRATVALHDLAGFDGRCEAVLLAADAAWRPPEDAEKLARLRQRLIRREAADGGSFDFVVVGGGIAGMCAAVTAARLGLKVALVHDRPVLGGNCSSEIRVAPSSVRNVAPYKRLGDVMAEVDMPGHPHPPSENKFLAADRDRRRLIEAEKDITLLLNRRVQSVGVEDGRIRSAVAIDITGGEPVRLTAPLWADCTGDANLGALAGAEWRMGRESKAQTREPRAPEQADNRVCGSTVHWYARGGPAEGGFPECPWALQFDRNSCQWATASKWNWETGFRRNQVSETELLRDHMLRAIFGNWDYQVHRSKRKSDYAKHHLAWVAYILGKRESRRLIGDVVYSQLDLIDGTDYPDNCIACDWGIDVHVAHPSNARHFPGWAFRSASRHDDRGKAPMRWLPYRSLYSRNIHNLLMAGRNASCTHLAFAWFRCQRTTGMMGEAVGMAAAVAADHDTLPRGVYEKHLPELKKHFQTGAGKRT